MQKRASLSASPLVVVLLLTAASTLASGCFLWTTRGEGDDLDGRVDALEAGLTREREQLRGELGRAKREVGKLEQIIEAASRTGADVGVAVSELEQRIERIEGQLAEIRELSATAETQVTAMREELDRRLAELNQPGVRLNPDQIPQNRTDHFAAAERELRREAYGTARALFREYIVRYATDERADDAQYSIALSYLRESNYTGALGEFRKVLTDHARGDMVDDTLLGMGDAFFQLNACTDAKAALNTLIRNHARSPLVTRARQKLQEIDRAPAGRCAS
jgi:TolA-binding protein